MYLVLLGSGCLCALCRAEMYLEVLWQCAAQLKLVGVLQLETLHNFGIKG